MSDGQGGRLKATAWVAFHLEAASIIDRYIRMLVAELESRGHTIDVCRDVDSAIKSAEDADIMLCWRILPEIFAKAKRLRWIQFGSSGIDHTLFPELLASDVILTNISGIHRTPVAEHVLGLMLAMSRCIDVSLRSQFDRRYDRSQIAPRAEELCGKTVGVLGLGKIGMEIARLCKCLGMRVIGTKRTPIQAPDYVDEVLSAADLDEVLKTSDYLVLVLPLTEGSKSLLGARELGLMKPTARIINVGRGAMIDEGALGEALSSGKLAGAALDVFTQEPLPPDSALYGFPNVIITPHVAGSHYGYAEKAFEIFRSNLDAFEAGRPMINVFDRNRGY
jgi:phosphoglycerate dehydrogenase-like enzyme